MQPLFKALVDLTDVERNDFTSWFSGLKPEEREAVSSTITTPDEIRILLTIPEQNRIAFFPVKNSPGKTLVDGFNKKVDEINKNIDATGLPQFVEDLRKKAEAFAKKQLNKK